ncbi:hypothetical protein M409DRAFT_30065 [Zasmidium cellare ATCC 36951]|uniref:JmjC domain-containing protein n=1 Tax=Zasmidium cellare ATCC 36951 TaxID=1080233 RepID=A0A6A6BXD1_ZASCE|nr:uncharacterized protein M409DRAFT_30065 [Zasmidium cellare ATCC 36951]KAF2159447.1 hypothetical protein M409DRAFT_30065 [Zasmidium cellare ATCC 36951]
MAKETTRPMMKGGRIVREPVAAETTASANRKTAASGAGATNTTALASGSITVTGGRSTTRQSNRIRGSGPAAIEGLDKESRLGRELSSQLIQNPGATRKRREREAKQNGLSGKGNAKWMGAWEPEVPDDYDDEESDEEAERQSNDTPADAGGKKGATGRKKRKAPTRTDATESSRPSKKPRKTGPSRRNQNSGETPPDDGGGGGDDDPDDKAQRPSRGPPRNPDEKFLRDCIEELQNLNPNNGTRRQAHIRNVLPILRQVRQPIDDRIQHFANILPEEDPGRPDCYILDAAEAKRLLESNVDVEAPVLVPNGAREGLFTGSMARPIEQVLRTWYLDANESTTLVDSLELEGNGREREMVTIALVRQRFLEREAERLHPWNLPDMPNPRPQHCVPHFMQSLNCNFLQDVLRRALDDTAEICPEVCPAALPNRLGCSNETHKLTHREFHKLKENSGFWQGTVMLAEPGAITTSHFDTWSMGTWISCHEGQIGLIWRSHPTDDEMRNQLVNDEDAGYHLEGTSIYKVLRPGDAVYMPSGTIHTVFRKPSGKQTLGLAGHIVRRSAAASWLKFLNMDAEDTADDWLEFKNDDYEFVVPPLARAVRAVLDPEQQRDQRELFGGRGPWTRANNRSETLLRTAERLQTVAFDNPSNSPANSPRGSRGPTSHAEGRPEQQQETQTGDQPDAEEEPNTDVEPGPNAEGGPEEEEEEADQDSIEKPPKRRRTRKATESETVASSSAPAASKRQTRKGKKDYIGSF